MSAIDAQEVRALNLAENPLLKPLHTSFLLHFTRPLIPAIMLAASGAIFLARGWLGNGFDGRGLGSILALPPMDAFGDFGFTGAGLKSLALTPIRVAALWLAMTQLLAAARKAEDGIIRTNHAHTVRRKAIGFGVIYLLALASVALVFLLLGWLLEVIGPALEGPARTEAFGSPTTPMLAGLLFYLAGLPLFLFLAVLLTSCMGRTLAGLPIRPSISQGAVWLAAFLSMTFWWAAVGPSPAPANTGLDFAGAFLVVLVQSVLYGAAVIAAGTNPQKQYNRAPLPLDFSVLGRKKPPSILKRLSA